MGKELENNNIVLNETAVQILLTIILCFMSLQPLMGVVYDFSSASDVEEVRSMINNFFLMKSELIRYNGYVALLVAIFASIMKERVSLKDFFARLYYKKPWNIFFTLLLIWIICNVLYIVPASFQDFALNGDPYRFEGLFSIIGYVGFFAAASMVTDERLKKIWMNFTIGASTLLGVCALHSLWSEYPRVLTYMNRQITGAGPLMATFPQFNHYGYYLCVVATLTAVLYVKESGKVKKVLYLILFGFHQYVLSLNGTRGAYLAAFVALLCFTLFCAIRRDAKKGTLGIMWVVFVAGTFCASSAVIERLTYSLKEVVDIANNTEIETVPTSGRNRLILWSNSIELIKMNWLTGYGLNTAAYALAQLRGIEDMPHNEYLQHFIDLGLPGFSLYVGALVTLFVSTLKKIKEIPTMVLVAGCGVIAYAVSAFFGVTIVEVLPFFYILLGFVKWERPVAVTETETPAETVEESENVAEAVEEVTDENI